MPFAQSAPAVAGVSFLPRAQAFGRTLPGRAVLAVAASLFVAASAHLSVPLPFTPVPLTFSDLAVLLVGLALGPATAFAALALYLAEGAAGLPVFSPFAGPGGVAHLFGSTGGYLLAYPFAAALAGLARRMPGVAAAGSRGVRFGAALLCTSAASAFVMLSGALWLVAVFHMPLLSAISLGVAPFVVGQIVKIVAASGIFASFTRTPQA